MASLLYSWLSVLRGGAGVNWNVRNHHGEYPLTIAIEEGHAECLQIILTVPEPHLDLSVTDPFGRNIAQIAVVSNGGDRQKSGKSQTDDTHLL